MLQFWPEEIADAIVYLASPNAGYVTGHVGKGYCHILWGCKKEILKEKFNIDWRSPAEMNPHCKFD